MLLRFSTDCRIEGPDIRQLKSKLLALSSNPVIDDDATEAGILNGEIGAAAFKVSLNKNMLNTMIQTEVGNVKKNMQIDDSALAKSIAKRKVLADRSDRESLIEESRFNHHEFQLLETKYFQYCDKETKTIGRIAFGTVLNDFLRERMERKGATEEELQKYTTETAKAQIDHAFDVFDTYGTGSIDFRDFILGCSVSLKGTVEQKVRALFDMYDVQGKGYISINELINLLSDGHKELWELVAFAEDFFARADEDGSNEIDQEEFKATVEKEPMLLEVFTKCVPSPMHLQFNERNDIRELSLRMRLTWGILRDIWIEFANIVINDVGKDEVSVTTPIFITGFEFSRLILRRMNPPQMDDNQLVYRVYKMFKVKSQKDAASKARKADRNNFDISKQVEKADTKETKEMGEPMDCRGW